MNTLSMCFASLSQSQLLAFYVALVVISAIIGGLIGLGIVKVLKLIYVGVAKVLKLI